MTDVNVPYGNPYGNPYGVQPPRVSQQPGMPLEQQGGPGNRQAAIIASVVVLALFGAFVFLFLLPKANKAGAQAADMEKIRKEYMERAVFAMGVKDPGRYAEERRALFKWYRNQLTEHENKYPGSVDATRYEAELKKKSGPEAEMYENRYGVAKEFWGLVESGKYMPEFTAYDQGLRFDVYRLEPTTVEGGPGVRLHFALYGVQRQWVDEQNNGAHIWHMRANMRFDRFSVEGRDAADKLKFEMSTQGGGGEPFNIKYPEMVIEEFPPATVIGYYEIPRIPAGADKVEIAFGIGTRSVVSGQESMGEFKWVMKDLPKDLRMPDGQTWQNAEVRVVESEEGK